MVDPERLRELIWEEPRAPWRQAVEQIAGDREEAAYVVGGMIRDLLAGRSPGDLDLVIEGDGIAFAEELARLLEARLRATSRFLTAELTLAGGERIDVSTARRERYAAPGALPEVEAAGLLEDLERRDFTVNTLALGVAGPAREGLLGHPRGLEDLRRRLVRILHPRSFRDDPTRLLRAVAVEIGLEARMEPETEALARQAVSEGILEEVSGARLWVEIEASLADAAATVATLERWRELGLLEVIFPAVSDLEDCLDRVEDALALLGRLRAGGGVGAPEIGLLTTLLAISWPWSDEAVVRWVDRFGPPRTYRRPLLSAHGRLGVAQRELASLESAEAAAAPSRIHLAMAELSLAELALLGVLGGSRRRAWVEREVTELRPSELAIAAGDLLVHGATPGPAVGEALERTLAARLDGLIERDGELDYALGQLGLAGRSTDGGAGSGDR